MPGRQSHGAAPSKDHKSRPKSKKRVVDALSIASHQNPDNIKIRQHRLGASEGGNRPGKKRARNEEDNEDEEEELQPKKPRKGPTKGRFDELDVDAGSDSEGNNWKLGQVDSDNDSDLDSDEAFGESDGERFDGFTFGGSSYKKCKKKSSKPRDITLNEADEDSESQLSDDSLGEDAVDLASMLDQMAGVSEDEQDRKSKDHSGEADSVGDEENEDVKSYDWKGSEESESVNEEDDNPSRIHPYADDSESIENDDEESDASEDRSSMSSRNEDEASDPSKLAAMHEMINNLPQITETQRKPERHRPDSGYEYKYPSRIGPPKTKLVFDDSKLVENHRSGKKAVKPLAVPISKRQQDRLDRSVAYDKAKETLERWTDTVKHNRRAEHLIFPLRDNDVISSHANTRLQRTSQAKPFNELEATIRSILEESGLAAANGKDDEDRIREFEELQTNKMSMDEVKARRDQLRMARELLFREEAKAKRIKKIKSKSYRRVHRKQREKEERLNEEALAEGGFVPSEDEVEAQDRRRAEERMGARHRGSEWAKATKETGRAAWDEDARADIIEMAMRDEELRKRIEGRSARTDDSDVSSNESDNEASEGNDDAERRRILRQLSKVDNARHIGESASGGTLVNMKFMLKADAARKKENDAMIQEIRKELAEEESASEDEDGDVGRRRFGPGSNRIQEAKQEPPHEFEEAVDSDGTAGNLGTEKHEINKTSKGLAAAPRSTPQRESSKTLQRPLSPPQVDSPSEAGAWSKVISKSSMVTDAEARKRQQRKNRAVEVEELDLSKAAIIATQPTPKKTSSMITTTLGADSEDEGDDENAVRVPFAIRDQELIKRAFAGADVVGEFEAEKRQIIEDEDEKVVDNTLPGWGSWTGDGLSKREKARNRGKVMTKLEGIKERHRKDAKLERVIINQKRVKKVGLLFLQQNRRATLIDFRMASILPRPSLILSRTDNSMKGLFGYPWDPSGRQKRPSRMPRSPESC